MSIEQYVHTGAFGTEYGGLTKLEYMTVQIANGLLSNPLAFEKLKDPKDVGEIATGIAIVMCGTLDEAQDAALSVDTPLGKDLGV